MSARNLFNLILKILGIFFLSSILEALSRLLSVLVYMPQYDSEQEAIFNLGVCIPPLVLYSLFAWALIFRTDGVINLLRLDKFAGANEISGLQVHRSVVLSIAIIAAGGWVLINELPEFFRHALYYYQERKIYVRMARPDVSYLAASALKVLIALFILIFNRTLVNVVELRRRKGTPWYWPFRIPFLNSKRAR